MSEVVHHDVIVVGLGGMGAAVLEACGRRGLRALGLEHHACIRHGKGRSHASSRGFRQTYGDPLLRELAAASRPYWAQLTPEHGRRIFEPCGATLSAPSGHPILHSVRASARTLGASCTTHSPAIQRSEFPGLPHNFETLFEPDAGWIRASAAVGAMCEMAKRQGARVRCRAHVQEIVHLGRGKAEVRLRDGEVFRASAVVLCTAGHVIPVKDATGHGVTSMREEPRFRRQVEHWFDVRACVENPFFERGVGMFHAMDLTVEGVGVLNLYGMLEQPGLLKCCMQSARYDDHYPSPERGASVGVEELGLVRAALATLWPKVGARANHLRAQVGWNVETTSGKFLLGPAQGASHIIHAQAFCGHGFKMFPALAERICDFVENPGE